MVDADIPPVKSSVTSVFTNASFQYFDFFEVFDRSSIASLYMEADIMAAYPQPALMPEAVCVAEGDGIGPEITSATLEILHAAGAPLEFRPVSMGVSCFREDLTSGIPPSTWDAIRDTGILLKGPMTTPQGSGMKSLNVTLRKSLGTHNVL